MRSRGAHSGLKFRRKVCSVKDVVSGVRPPHDCRSCDAKEPKRGKRVVEKANVVR